MMNHEHMSCFFSFLTGCFFFFSSDWCFFYFSDQEFSWRLADFILLYYTLVCIESDILCSS